MAAYLSTAEARYWHKVGRNNLQIKTVHKCIDCIRKYMSKNPVSSLTQNTEKVDLMQSLNTYVHLVLLIYCLVILV